MRKIICVYSVQRNLFFNIFILKFLKTRHGTQRQGGQTDPSLENFEFIFPILYSMNAHSCCPGLRFRLEGSKAVASCLFSRGQLQFSGINYFHLSIHLKLAPSIVFAL